VTLVNFHNATCTITNNDNAPSPHPATLTVIKHVINDNGGTAATSSFALFVGSTSVQSGVTNEFPAGTYTVHEDNLAGYTQTGITGDCTAQGSVTLAAGDNKVCTITNNDNPQPVPATIKLVKTVINDNGGTKVATDFHLYVGTTSVTNDVAKEFAPGAYTVREDASEGYAAGAWGGDCASDGSVTLAAGQNKVCTITNNDIGGGGSEHGFLTLIKRVINDDGRNATANDWTLSANGPTPLSGDGGVDKTQVLTGTYDLSEAGGPSAYDASDWVCTGEGLSQSDGNTVVISNGDDITCTITNNDRPSGGGGGGGGGGSSSRRHPNVTLFSNPQVLGASISLAQVPYTGLATSLLQIFLFFIGLIALSGGVVYVFMRRRVGDMQEMQNMGASARAYSSLGVQPQQARVLHEETISPAPAPVEEDLASYGEYLAMDNSHERVSYAPNNLPTAPVTVASVVAQSPVVRQAQEYNEHRPVAALLASLQSAALAAQAIISEDGMKLVMASVENNNEQKTLERLAQVIDVAKTRYPREDGWLILDRERVRESLFISILSTVPLFIEWIVRGEDKHVFAFMRMLKMQNQPVGDFIRKVVAELDNAHRARLEGVSDIAVDPHVAEVTYHLDTRDLEAIVSELLLGVDERYDSAYTSVRLALVRVLDIVKSRHMTRIGGTYAFQPEESKEA
jgi:hypothetical protein